MRKILWWKVISRRTLAFFTAGGQLVLQVFEDEWEYMRFLTVLRRQTQPDVDENVQTFPSRCHVYAYCLMD